MSHAADSYHGILLLDKPAGITSHDAVDRVRKTIGQRSVGHAGTLDPAAEGLLLICLGRATKVARFLSALDKTYEAEVKLGLESTTYDAEGIDREAVPAPVPRLDEAVILDLLSEFTGRFRQMVPAYSAVHVDGRRMYDLAREGRPVLCPERTVEVHQLSLLAFEPDRLRLKVTCSKGTYIRTLAHDIGRRLGCGGYLSYLCRTKIGRHCRENAFSLEDVRSLCHEESFESHLVPIEQALDFGMVTVSDECSRRVRHGRQPQPQDITGVEGDFQPGDRILLKDSRGSVLAVGMATISSLGFRDAQPKAIIEYDRVLN